MIFFRINSKSLSRSPTNVSQSKIKLQKSERTMDGTLVTDIIAVKDAVTFSWSYLTDADLRRLILETQNYAFCTVEYQDGSSADIGTPKRRPARKLTRRR